MSRHKPHLDPATGSPLHPLPPSSAGTEQPATREYVLRAMARNYKPGNSWDHLDAEACIQAANEIKALRDRIAALEARGVLAPAQQPMNRGDWAQLLTLRDVMRSAYKKGGDRLMSVWERDLNAIEAAIMILDKAAQPPAAPVEKSGIMQAAAKAAEKVASWSPSKRDYANRAVGGECSSAATEHAKVADWLEDQARIATNGLHCGDNSAMIQQTHDWANKLEAAARHLRAVPQRGAQPTKAVVLEALLNADAQFGPNPTTRTFIEFMADAVATALSRPHQRGGE
jgi:hypothetical protein